VPASDLDLFVAWTPEGWLGRADTVRPLLAAAVARAGLGFDIAQGDAGSFFPAGDQHPERRAFRLIGDQLAGRLWNPVTQASRLIAGHAVQRRQRAALAALCRMEHVLDALDEQRPLYTGAAGDIAAAAGYIRADGKDRRSDADLAALLPALRRGPASMAELAREIEARALYCLA
jgi:hypothetical protein